MMMLNIHFQYTADLGEARTQLLNSLFEDFYTYV